MSIDKKAVYRVTVNGIQYRFTDIMDHYGLYYTGKMAYIDGKIGSMIHRITREEMEQATIEQEQEQNEQE